MTDPIYLITGSTGTTGRVAVEQLLKDGKRVRAMIHKEDKRSAALRDLGAETVMGNFLELDEVKSAIEGATGAYFCYPLRNGLIDAAAFFAQAARECDLKSIVNMSQISARREAKSHAARDHWITEQVFNWSGVSSTHIRPTYFAEWLTYTMPGWRVKDGILRFPFANGRHAPIAGEDQGRVVAKLLQNPNPHAGKVYPLFGPVEMDHHEIAARLSKTLGRTFNYKPLTIPEFRVEMEAGGFSQRMVQHICSTAQDYQDGVFAGTNDIVEKLTGQAPLSVEQFVERNRAAFA